jgi:hypothetical protein
MPNTIPQPLTPDTRALTPGLRPLPPDSCFPAPDPWERQPGEANLWYARFERYRLAGPQRSFLGILNDERVRRGKKKGRSIPQAWADNIKRWRWRDRALAWDEQERWEARLRHAQAIEDANQRQIQDAQALQNKASLRLQAMDPEDLSPMAVLRFIVEGVKLEREARSQPDPVHEQHGAAPLPWSLEDVVEAEQELDQWRKDRWPSAEGEPLLQTTSQTP